MIGGSPRGDFGTELKVDMYVLNDFFGEIMKTKCWALGITWKIQAQLRIEYWFVF